MAHATKLAVQEDSKELKELHRSSAVHLRPRIKMLQWILKSVHSIDDLSSKVGVSRNSIARWKRTYNQLGLSGLLADERGGDFRSGIDSDTKQKIELKLSDPHNAFTSYKQAQQWLRTDLNIDKQYHAINKYLKRNFGTKLKVGRKSHVKKDESAVAVFKNAT
jgi:transposase